MLLSVGQTSLSGSLTSKFCQSQLALLLVQCQLWRYLSQLLAIVAASFAPRT